MTYTDPRAFEGIEVREPKASDYIKNPVLCPVCAGHGRWHLKIDAYGAGKHFDASCFQCNGWGYVSGDSTSATCIHTFISVAVGRCLHEYTCTECGEKRIIDSSD